MKPRLQLLADRVAIIQADNSATQQSWQSWRKAKSRCVQRYPHAAFPGIDFNRRRNVETAVRTDTQRRSGRLRFGHVGWRDWHPRPSPPGRKPQTSARRLGLSDPTNILQHTYQGHSVTNKRAAEAPRAPAAVALFSVNLVANGVAVIFVRRRSQNTGPKSHTAKNDERRLIVVV